MHPPRPRSTGRPPPPWPHTGLEETPRWVCIACRGETRQPPQQRTKHGRQRSRDWRGARGTTGGNRRPSWRRNSRTDRRSCDHAPRRQSNTLPPGSGPMWLGATAFRRFGSSCHLSSLSVSRKIRKRLPCCTPILAAEFKSFDPTNRAGGRAASYIPPAERRAHSRRVKSCSGQSPPKISGRTRIYCYTTAKI